MRDIDGVEIVPAYAHRAAAARLVHNLKYRRSLAAGRLLADAMADLVPDGASCLVPVPRSIARRVRYGIDQTDVLARMIGASRGLPIRRAFGAPPWWRRRAGMERGRRRPVSFHVVGPVPAGAVVVDDVLTTGATIASVAGRIPHREFLVVTATAAGSMESTGRTDHRTGR